MAAMALPVPRRPRVRIGILSYPMLFQRDAALQLQVRATIGALTALASHAGHALRVDLADPSHTQLKRYDVLHVFGATDGNERVVEVAADLGVPVVLSPLLGPGWHADGVCASGARHPFSRAIHARGGARHIQARRALQLATLVLALGEAERCALAQTYSIDIARLRTFGHGVAARFFDADGDIFRAHTGIVGPFVLMPCASAAPSGQLAVVQAMAELALPLVLAGTREQDRLPPDVHCIAGLGDDERLRASACAAASVCVLAGGAHDDALPALEALAAGTPVVASMPAARPLPNGAGGVRLVRGGDIGAIKRAVMAFLSNPPARSVLRAPLRTLAWDQVAHGIAACYVEAAGRTGGAQRRRTVSSRPW
jgi:hypothetical protein